MCDACKLRTLPNLTSVLKQVFFFFVHGSKRSRGNTHQMLQEWVACHSRKTSCPIAMPLEIWSHRRSLKCNFNFTAGTSFLHKNSAPAHRGVWWQHNESAVWQKIVQFENGRMDIYNDDYKTVVKLGISGPSTLLPWNGSWPVVSLGHWHSTLDGIDSTVTRDWKWLFTKGCECRSLISTMTAIFNGCQYGTNPSMCSVIMSQN